MQQVVRLLGDLGDRYGAEHTYYDLRTPADAIKLLCVNLPEFQQELLEAHKHGVGYRLIQAGTDLDYSDLQLPIGSNDLILTPVISGSGDGVGQILAGVGLIAASFIPGVGALAATLLFSVGTSLALGGISEMLSPQPTIPTFGGVSRLGSGEASSTDGPQSITRGSDGRQSYAYTGAANTVGVGATIPVAYGEVLIGSHLLSANVDVADESDPLKTAVKAPGAETVLFGGEKLSFNFSTASGVKVKRTNRSHGVTGSTVVVKNQSFNLQNGALVNGGADIGEISSLRKEFDLILQLNDGLFEHVSGPGSTKVDGYITYEVKITIQTSGVNRTIAVSRATIQGLLLPGQTYSWVHRIEHPDVDDSLRPEIQIIDFRADPSCRFFWQSYGYRLD